MVIVSVSWLLLPHAFNANTEIVVVGVAKQNCYSKSSCPVKMVPPPAGIISSMKLRLKWKQ